MKKLKYKPFAFTSTKEEKKEKINIIEDPGPPESSLSYTLSDFCDIEDSFKEKARNDSGIKKLVINIVKTYREIKPDYDYQEIKESKKCLTYPDYGVYNNNLDNEEHNLIVYAGDIIHNYYVVDLLGQGISGRVYEVYLNNEKQRLQYIDGVANVMLDEIVVEKKKRRKIESVYDLLSSMAYNYKYFDKWSITSYDSAIRRFAGISIKPNGLFYRGELVGIFIDGDPIVGWKGPDSGHFSFASDPKTNASDPNTNLSTGANTMVSASDDSYNLLQMMYPFTWVRQIDFIPPGASAGFSSYAGGILRITLKNGTEEGFSKRNYTIKKFLPLGYQRAAEFYAPRYDTGNNGIGEGTDLRETLYWNPNVAIGSNKQARFNFYTNDVANTSYTITVEGVTQSGELIHATKKITKK